MASIDELRDIVFYILRKLNDVIINYTREEPQPPRFNFPRRSEEERQRIDEEHETISRRIEELRRSVNGENPTDNILEESIRQYEERIKDLQKQIHEKRIILNYLLDKLIELRELKADTNTITHLEEEFERLRLEREKLEEMLTKLKEHKRFMQN